MDKDTNTTEDALLSGTIITGWIEFEGEDYANDA